MLGLMLLSMVIIAGYSRRPPTPQVAEVAVDSGMASEVTSEAGLDEVVATPIYGYTVVPFLVVIVRLIGIAVS